MILKVIHSFKCHLLNIVIGLVPIWTYDCSSSRLFPVYVPMHSTVAQYKQYLKLETKDIKKQKQDFLIWNGKLIDSTLPKDTNIENSIIYLGNRELNLKGSRSAQQVVILKFKVLPKKRIFIYLTRLNLQKSESFRPSIKIPNLVEFAVVHFMTFQNQFNISLKSKFKDSFQKIRLDSHILS